MLQNNCEKQSTLDLFNRFIDNPHCIGGTMYQSDESIEGCDEIVEITINHLLDVITVVFNVDTQIGQVLLHGIENELITDSTELMGVITVEKFQELLDSLPHISNFMEDVVGDGVLH